MLLERMGRDYPGSGGGMCSAPRGRVWGSFLWLEFVCSGEGGADTRWAAPNPGQALMGEDRGVLGASQGSK